MNPGSEPERDDTGLPPVDIEIPDDARELDRDVQAYYRELRALRRQRRGHRTRGSLAKDGVVLPLLACCLILALITGTLLTVFTATSEHDLTGLSAGKPTAPPSARAARSGATSAGARSGTASPSAPGAQTGAFAKPDVVPGLRPRATITVDGQPTPVQGLHHVALVLIPVGCNCTATVSWLINVVTGANARSYLVYNTSTQAAVLEIYTRLTAGQHVYAHLAFEPDTSLASSVTDNPSAGTLTAILLGPTKVADATSLRPNDDPTTLIRALTH